MTNRYVIAPKHEKLGQVAPDWQRQLAAIAGVSVQGAAKHRAQFLADATALEKVRELFAADFLIEAVIERKPPDS